MHIDLFFEYVQVDHLHCGLYLHCINSNVENPFGSSIQVLFLHFSVSPSSRQYHQYYVKPGMTRFASQ